MNLLASLPNPFFVLAPMDDVTDTVFRQIVSECAKPELFFTEFVNVDGLQSPGRPRLMHKLLLSNKEKPVIAQIWGLKPENYYKTTLELIEMGYAGVDINMGCPVKTVVKNGACAALINNRELAGQIIDAVKEAAGEKVPVSVKTRVGYKNIDLSWIEFVLSKKLDMLSIHTRTAAQKSSVPADMSLMEQIVKLRDNISPTTFIAANGDVNSRKEGIDLAAKYNLDGIMIGRGIFNDPFIFAENSPWNSWSPGQKINLFEKHIQLHLETYKNGERRFETLRKFCKVYINGFEGASDLRAKFMETENAEQALPLLQNAIAHVEYSYGK